MSRFALWKQEWVDEQIKIQKLVLLRTTKENLEAEKKFATKK